MNSRSISESIRALAFGTYAACGLDRLAAQRGHAHILNLHRVHEDLSPYWPPMHPAALDWLLNRLLRLGKIVDIQEIAARRVPSGERLFALSFDDGYADFVKYALPVLESHGVPSNLNIVVESTRSGEAIWNARLYDALARAGGDFYPAIAEFFPEDWSIDGLRTKAHLGFKISNGLRSHSRAERERAIRILEALCDYPGESVRALRVDEVRALPVSVHVGAHGETHEPLSHVSMEEFRSDVEACRVFFETELNSPMETYAFPLGGYRQEQVEHLLDTGVTQILLVDEEPTVGDRSVLPRLTVGASKRGHCLAEATGLRRRLASAVQR
jgi:peptidoglycan/xylan/chitin deacetylase (PgdA/CDA1 family)